MNGSENAYAGAMLFALISLGAVLKIEDILIGGAVGGACALLAAIFFRIALNKAAQATEENYQRTEVQFQQLRTKIIESTESNINAMNYLGEVTQLLRENLQLMNSRQSELKNLTELARNIESIHLTLLKINDKQQDTTNLAALDKNVAEINSKLAAINDKQIAADNFAELAQNVAAIHSTLVGLEENSFAVNTGLEKISVAIQSQPKSTEEFKKLLEIQETNKANLQTAMKILHVIAQTIRNTSYANDFEKINAALERLGSQNEIFTETSANAAQINLSNLVKISGNLSRSFTTTLDDLRLDMVKLSARIEEINSMMNKAATEENPVKKLRRR